jgi:hypothetical protein
MSGETLRSHKEVDKEVLRGLINSIDKTTSTNDTPTLGGGQINRGAGSRRFISWRKVRTREGEGDERPTFATLRRELGYVADTFYNEAAPWTEGESDNHDGYLLEIGRKKVHTRQSRNAPMQ